MSDKNISANIKAAAGEMRQMLKNRTIPFWLDRSVDMQYGGYLVCMDQNGTVNPDAHKMIITQARMLWGFSALLEFAEKDDIGRMESAANQGYEFLIKNFWDGENGGFFWETLRSGELVDGGKLTYAQSFAIYALCQYYLAYKNPEALAYAEKTFDLLQKYAADNLHGGYFENLEPDWSASPGGVFAGDRKSLDIHMHLMEAFTVLFLASGKDIHKKKLTEVIAVIMSHMVNKESGYGLNQFDSAFCGLPAINIHRTWNADRETGETLGAPADTTSYGHNVELSWLLRRAFEVLGEFPDELALAGKKLLDHSLLHGYDHEFGGVYRDGIGNEPALVKDKEWWQNFESMTGYLYGYKTYGDERFLEAFFSTWEFIKKYFIIERFGESRQLLKRNGEPIISAIGNPWKAVYHTGRSLSECVGVLKELEGSISVCKVEMVFQHH